MAATLEAELKTITISEQQADQLELAMQYAKALATPTRLAIIGLLANSIKEMRSVDELAREINIPPQMLVRDLRQLAEAGFIVVEQWDTQGGQEPQPSRVRFNPDYLKQAPQAISVLHQLHAQVRPAAAKEKLDERGQVLSRFMKDGRILALPVGFKRTKYLLDEVVKAFEAEHSYSEREVDAIIKEIYPPDHCTIRRYLVDSGLLHRENGIYWKA